MSEVAKFTSLLSALIVLATIVGCDRPPSRDPDVPTDVKIRRLVWDVDDFSQEAGEIKQVPRLFAPESQPDAKQLQRYAEFRYEVKQLAQSADAATLTVGLKDAKSGEDRGDVKWSAKKINNVWKLTDAPLLVLLEFRL